MIDRVSYFFSTLKLRNALLYHLGMVLAFLFLIFLIGFIFCDEALFHICHWLKPFKFAASFALYAFSLGWFLEYLKELIGQDKIYRISRWIVGLIIVELVLILMHSSLSSDSYATLQIKESTTAQAGEILALLSDVIIVANAIVVMYICYLFFHDINLKPTSYLWAIRLSLVIFIISCFLGLFLLGRYGQVPVDPNRLGLPFTKTSSVRSNLISAHFVGIHYLQLLPLLGYYSPKKWAMGTVIFLTLAYLLVTLALVYQSI